MATMLRKGKRGKWVVALSAGTLLIVLAFAASFWREIAWRVDFHWRFEYVGRNAQGYAEYRHRKTDMIFVRIPSASFRMGSPPREAGHFTMEEPQHAVSLSTFLVAKYEVTQAQWKRFMGTNPSKFTGDSLPVHGVSWDECKEFCRRTGLRLPSEAEWEYASRAGDREWAHQARPGFQGRLPDAPNGSGKGLEGLTLEEIVKRLDEVAWHGANSQGKAHPVGEKRPNGFGLHDMLGNVFEFCEDAFERDFYSRIEASGLDPVCRSALNDRVTRGGSFWQLDDLQNYRSTYRIPQKQDLKSFEVLGFRAAYGPVP